MTDKNRPVESREEIDLGAWARAAIVDLAELSLAADHVIGLIDAQVNRRMYWRALVVAYVRRVAAELDTMESPEGGRVGHRKDDAQAEGATPSTIPVHPGAAGQDGRGSHFIPASSDTIPAQPVSGGQNLSDHQNDRPPASSSLASDSQSGSAPQRVASQAKEAPRPAWSLRDVQPAARPALMSGSDMKRLAINRMTELGKPVGQCSKVELEKLSYRSAIDAAFFSALALSMPPTGNVEDYMTAKDVDEVLHLVRTAAGVQKKLVIDLPFANEKRRAKG